MFWERKNDEKSQCFNINNASNRVNLMRFNLKILNIFQCISFEYKRFYKGARPATATRRYNKKKIFYYTKHKTKSLQLKWSIMKSDIAKRSRRRRSYNVSSTYNKYHQQSSSHSHEMRKSVFLIHERSRRSLL